jgi:hypothetical protein
LSSTGKTGGRQHHYYRFIARAEEGVLLVRSRKGHGTECRLPVAAPTASEGPGKTLGCFERSHI